MASALPWLPSAGEHLDRIALRAGPTADAEAVTYGALLERSAAVAGRLLTRLGVTDLDEERVCAAVSPDPRFVYAQLGVYRAGGALVPIALAYPPEEMDRVLDDARPALVLVDEENEAKLRPLAEERGLPVLRVEEAAAGPAPGSLPAVDEARAALMLFTSGTTSRPKGVLLRHKNLLTQLRVLTEAWGWRSDDVAALFLPLHHVHGLQNVLGCGLFAGAELRMCGAFDAEAIWRLLEEGELSVLMAVPTVYHRLIRAFDEAAPERQERMGAGAARARLMVSGSAALPVPVLERWRSFTGHTLLERYGMTEIGMALSNPYRGERVAGSVGFPLPTVAARVRSDEDGTLLDEGADGEGTLEVRGPSVFDTYWERPEATAEAFTDDGWFQTGDRVRRTEGRYAILGRSSVDILKSGGFKVSALEIESVLLDHEAISACAVVGVPHEEWGEEITAVVELAAGAEAPELRALRTWAKERLAPYKVPRRLEVRPLPRNAMGKVQKPALVRELDGKRGGEGSGP